MNEKNRQQTAAVTNYKDTRFTAWIFSSFLFVRSFFLLLSFPFVVVSICGVCRWKRLAGLECHSLQNVVWLRSIDTAYIDERPNWWWPETRVRAITIISNIQKTFAVNFLFVLVLNANKKRKKKYFYYYDFGPECPKRKRQTNREKNARKLHEKYD